MSGPFDPKVCGKCHHDVADEINFEAHRDHLGKPYLWRHRCKLRQPCRARQRKLFKKLIAQGHKFGHVPKKV